MVSKDRLSQWMLMVRQWRHIKMAKRAGRGHDPSGIDGTSRGGLSVPCRACPHPDINLPDGWDDAPPQDRCVLNLYHRLILVVTAQFRWLYTLFLAEDANFKQKAQLRSDTNKDPPLGPGWGTFVENMAYLEYVSQFAGRDEVGSSQWHYSCRLRTKHNVVRFHTVQAFRHCHWPTTNNQKVCDRLV